MNHTSSRMTPSAEFHIDTHTSNIAAKKSKAEDDAASYSTIASNTSIEEANLYLSVRKSSHDSKAAEPRASDIEDASQGLLSFKQKGRKRTSPASPTHGEDEEQEKSLAYKRPKSRTDSLNSLCRSPHSLLGEEQDKKLLEVKPTKTQSISTNTLSQENRKKNEIINIAQKNLKTAMDILSAYNKPKPSGSQDIFRNTTDTNAIKSNTNSASRSASFDLTSPRATFNCTSHDSASSSISVNSGVSNASNGSPKLVSTNNKASNDIHSNLQLQRTQDIEGRMIKLQNHFMSEMAHLQQELMELKQNNYSSASTIINKDTSNKRYRSVTRDVFSMKEATSNLQTTPCVSYSHLHNSLSPEKHTKISASDSSLPLITEPTDKDVISGRGHGANRHGGNQNYRNLVKKYKVQYIKAITDLDKHQISMQVVNEIHEDGGRFLKRVYGHECVQWEVMDMNEIKKKVSQALRENASDLRNILSQQSRNASPVLHASDISSPSPPLVIMSSNGC